MKYVLTTDDNWTGVTRDDPLTSICSLWDSVVTDATRTHERSEARHNTALHGFWRNIARRRIREHHENCGDTFQVWQSVY